MIIKMFKTVLLCLASDREAALQRLQELGVMQVEILRKAESTDRPALENKVADLGKVINMLTMSKPEKGDTPLQMSGEEIVAATLQLMEIIAEASKNLVQLRRDREKLLPWGNFSFQSLATLEKNGIHVYLCTGTPADLKAAQAHGVGEIIHEERGKLCFALITEKTVDMATLPLAGVPTGISLRECEEKIATQQRAREAAEQQLAHLAVGLPEVRAYETELQDQLEFLNARDGMTSAGELCYLQGFVPEPECARLREEARRNGWALELEAADRHDPMVPTLIKIPKMFRIIEPMMKFLGIAPGYDEMDVSICFLFFLSIFFGMILGDAGYGLLIFIPATIAGFKLRQPEVRRGLRLMQVFGAVTIIWGWLTGAWFGLDASRLPHFMRGIHWFTDPATRDSHIQLLCFTLAIMHLTTGRLWKAIIHWGSIRAVLGEIGWTLILWGNFFLTLKLLVFPGPIHDFILYLYIAGLALVVLFGVNWRDMGEVFNFPFGVIGTFVDILSYIRLYAVGMSGMYIASSFNGMAGDIFSLASSPATMALFIVVGVLILLIGHGLNLALCFMGVLVHGVRLNTLEFSNHIGLRWAGRPYKAFSKQQK
ncbi:MAG: hypothetical protein PHQ27_00355 [Victivallales bacterium]|nr:hypothetical protein [Victivallales bacterium]